MKQSFTELQSYVPSSEVATNGKMMYEKRDNPEKLHAL